MLEPPMCWRSEVLKLPLK